jgi:flagellar basal-body rod modification protein FlgD
MAGSVDGVGSSNQSSNTGTTTGTNDAFQKLDMDTFLRLLVAEMQNQDPMNPMDDTQIVQQVSQIDQIQASQKLTDTLKSVALGQSVATASNLIGQTVTGLDEEGDSITGAVASVSIADGKTTLNVGEHQITLNNVTQLGTAAQQ